MGVQCCISKPSGFEIQFDLTHAEDGDILVTERVPNPETWYIDTLELKDGKAVYRGKVSFPHWVSFTFRKGDGDFHGASGLFLDNSRVRISGDYRDIKHLQIEGSPSNDEYDAIQQQGKQLFKRDAALAYQRSKAFKDSPEKYDSLSLLHAEAHDRLYDYLMSVPGYQDSQVAAFLVYDHFNGEDIVRLEKALDRFSPRMSSNPFIAECRANIDREKKVLPGQEAFDFTLKDLSGKEYRLSDFRGRYVLLEFSASWCGWCRKEIPYLKEVYECTRGKDFTMLTVNLDDKRENWEEDVKTNALPWPVISDLKAFNGPAAIRYNVSGIPQTYLISPEGRILERGLRREKMVERIKGLFNGQGHE